MSIQGHLLEVTVVGCNKLKDTEWISRQDPYVCIEYGGTKNRTRTHTDGGKNPVFQEKFVFTLIEGLRELNLVVWNSNTLTFDDFIGTGKVPLQKVLSQGYDDSPWPLQTKTGRYAGEVRLILHYANHNKHATNFSPSAPPYATQPPRQGPFYSAPPPSSASPYPPPSTAYPASSPYPPSYPPFPSPYPPSQPSAYPPSQPSAYPPNHPSAYPPNQPSAYPPNQPSTYPPNQPSAYPPNQPSTYPPSAYPPVYPPPYPPPPHTSSYYPPGPLSRLYPPPPY